MFTDTVIKCIQDGWKFLQFLWEYKSEKTNKQNKTINIAQCHTDQGKDKC